jgi:hypothetical protein
VRAGGGAPLCVVARADDRGGLWWPKLMVAEADGGGGLWWLEPLMEAT